MNKREFVAGSRRPRASRVALCLERRRAGRDARIDLLT
jgi:hypothetical protein